MTKIRVQKVYNPTENVDLPEKSNSINGLGDVVSTITSFLGIEECDKCKKRKEELNKAFPVLSKAEPINQDDIDFIKYLKTLKTINHVDIKILVFLYNKAFKQNINCTTCGSVLKSAIEKLYSLYLYKYATDEKEFD